MRLHIELPPPEPGRRWVVEVERRPIPPIQPRESRQKKRRWWWSR